MKRRTGLAIAALCWLGLEVLSWALNSFLESSFNASSMSWLQEKILDVLLYLSSGFSLGFFIGAAIFSIWDWPVIGIWLKRKRERLRNREADEILARDCDQLSKDLYESAAQVERIRSEKHFHSSTIDSSEGIHSAWVEARAAEAREEENIRRKFGGKMQGILIKLKDRGIKMDLWNISLSSYQLGATSYFFADIANALRDGTYLEKEFKCGPLRPL